MDLIYILLAFTIAFFATMSFYITWFFSDFPVLVTVFIRCVSRSTSSPFWIHPGESPENPVDDMTQWTRDDWSEWSHERLPWQFDHMLNCPPCLSWWLSLAGGAVGSFFSPLPTVVTIFICFICFPGPIHYLFKK